MDKSLNNTKCMSMYLSTAPSAYEEMFYKHIKCDWIYSRDWEEGTLYCIFHTNPSKSHKTLDHALTKIESEIKSDPSSPVFQCISSVMSKKVKTFSHQQHVQDQHYNAIFTNPVPGCNKERQVQDGVRTWRPSVDIKRKFNSEPDPAVKMAEMEKRLKTLEGKASAWDKHEDYLSNKRLKDATTLNGKKLLPMPAMINLAKLVGVDVKTQHTYKELRKQVLLKVHPDKNRHEADQLMLFEKICKAVNNMPDNI